MRLEGAPIVGNLSIVHFPSYIFVFLNNGQRSGSQETVWEKLTRNKQWPWVVYTLTATWRSDECLEA